MFSAERLLIYLYKNSVLQRKLHLQGGAALALVHRLDRIFSNDLDFTVNDVEGLKCLVETLSKFVEENKFGFKIIQTEHRITLTLNEKEVFHLDVFVVNPEICEFSYIEYSFNNEEELINVHSVNDIFTEKLYCMLTRKEIRDLKDIKILIDTGEVNLITVKDLFKRKREIKKSTFQDINLFKTSFNDIASTYQNKFPNDEKLISYTFNKLSKYIN